MFGHCRPSRSRRETRGVGVPGAGGCRVRGWSINDVLDTNTPTITGSNEPRFVLGAKIDSCSALDYGLLHRFKLVAHWRRIVHR